MSLRTPRRRARRAAHTVSLLGLAVPCAIAWAGCLAPATPATDAPCSSLEERRAVTFRDQRTVDLLFMIDNSNSMAHEQALLRREIPRMIQALTTGEFGVDGAIDALPVESLHVGVITSDLGAGDVPAGDTVPSCDEGLGDDGIFRSTSRGGSGCARSYPSRLFAWEQPSDPIAFANEVGCVADLGTGGCGFEQQLEVILKALSPVAPQPYVSSTYVPPIFALDGRGHGDRENAGFLREGSVLAIILLSDEDDTSVPDYDLFHPDSPAYRGTPLNLRSFRFPDALHPVQRYIDGYLQLRDDPRSLVFLPIVGVPADLPRRGLGPCDPFVLSDPRVQTMQDTTTDPPARLLPSCTTPDGVAFAPRRIIEVACGLEESGALVTLQSICASSYAFGIGVVLNRLRAALEGDCIEPLPAERTCEALLVLPPGQTCDALGLTPVEGGCAVPPLPEGDPTGVGWLRDEARRAVEHCGAGHERVLLRGLSPPAGSRMELRCVPAEPSCG